MDRFILIVNDHDEYWMFPVSSFVGAKYSTAQDTVLYFEKAPMAFSFKFRHGSGHAPMFLKEFGDLCNMSPKNVIEFNDLSGHFDSDYITAVTAGTPIVVK
tara:strand:+ start:180 stop:482 length:303 start_codon:yes stop_codon:yes gene_type:complete